MLPESTQRRLNYMVDPEMYRHEPLYHGMVSQFRMWLVGAEMAMRDEEVDNEVIECVLNRMVYGHPSGAEAHERRDLMRQQREMAEKMPPNTGVLTNLLGEKKTPREWEQQSSDITHIVVDPDGWRGEFAVSGGVKEYPFSRNFLDAITLAEYQARAMASTVRPKDQKEHVAH